MDIWYESVRERRLTAGLSPDQLGALAGVNGETVRRIERGEHCSPASRRKIDEALQRGSDAERLLRLERQVADLESLLRDVLAAALDRNASVPPAPTGRQASPRKRA